MRMERWDEMGVTEGVEERDRLVSQSLCRAWGVVPAQLAGREEERKQDKATQNRRNSQKTGKVGNLLRVPRQAVIPLTP